MKLEELLKGCSLRAAAGDLGVEILGLAYDSRRLRPGDAFFAIRGTRMDGNRFVPNAIEKGPPALVAARPATPPVSAPCTEVGAERSALRDCAVHEPQLLPSRFSWRHGFVFSDEETVV